MEKQQIKIEVEKQALALTNVIFQHTNEEFGLLCVSGHIGRQYLLSPAHAKRIYLRLGEHIAAYEKNNGEIKASLPVSTKNESGEEKSIGF